MRATVDPIRSTQSGRSAVFVSWSVDCANFFGRE